MKLSARGRSVVAQVSRTLPKSVGDGTVRTDYVLLSDGVIGRKVTFHGEPGTHDTGWKVKSRLKPEAHAELKHDPHAVAEKWVARHVDAGFTRVK